MKTNVPWHVGTRYAGQTLAWLFAEKIIDDIAKK